MLNKITTVRRSPMRVADSVVTATGEKIPCVVGQTSQVDFVSQNGYRYKKGFWNKVLSDSAIQEKIQARDMLGCIEHPISDEEYLKTPYEKASHIVLKAWVADDGNPWATFGILNNPHGNAIKALLDMGHQPGVSTRGLGEFEIDDQSQFVSDDNYAFLTWDLVRNPNFQSLKMEKVTDSIKSSPLFKEVCQMYHLRDSVDTSYNRDSLFKEIGAGISELQRKFELLSSL